MKEFQSLLHWSQAKGVLSESGSLEMKFAPEIGESHVLLAISSFENDVLNIVVLL